MQKLSLSLIKQLSLLLVLGLTVSYLAIGKPHRTTIVYAQGIFTVIYLFLSVAEFSSRLSRMNLPVDRFFYLPYAVISNKTIRLGAYAIAAGVLWVSDSALIFLATILFVLILADVLVFFLKIKQRVYYISLMANYVYVCLEKEQKIFASQIDRIEYRYDIFFLKLKGKKTITLETDRLHEDQKELFTEKMVQWAVRNQLEFTEEAKGKLQYLLN